MPGGAGGLPTRDRVGRADHETPRPRASKPGHCAGPVEFFLRYGLEKKGVAASSYVLGEGHASPGRSMVVFYPTHKAARFLTQLRQEVLGGDEWHQAKEILLQRIRETQESNYAEAVREILARLPDVKTILLPTQSISASWLPESYSIL